MTSKPPEWFNNRVLQLYACLAHTRQDDKGKALMVLGYWSALRHFSREDISLVFDAALKNARFMPRPAELAESCRDLVKPKKHNDKLKVDKRSAAIAQKVRDKFNG